MSDVLPSSLSLPVTGQRAPRGRASDDPSKDKSRYAGLRTRAEAAAKKMQSAIPLGVEAPEPRLPEADVVDHYVKRLADDVWIAQQIAHGIDAIADVSSRI